MLHKKVQTLHIWLTTPNKLSGTTLSHKWKFLILLMARSTSNVTEAISRVLITSCAVIWLLDPKKGGMFRVTPSGSRSSIVKPLSAIMVSPLSNSNFRKPLRSTILWLEMFPLYSWLPEEEWTSSHNALRFNVIYQDFSWRHHSAQTLEQVRATWRNVLLENSRLSQIRYVSKDD